MARRDESIFDVLIEVPWWVGVITSGVLYVAMRYVLPSLLDDGSMMIPIAELSRMFALPVAALALLASGVSALRSLGGRARTGGKGSPAAGTSRSCPHCGSRLVLRRASRGARAGSSFWGCSGYPKCRYTENVAG